MTTTDEDFREQLQRSLREGAFRSMTLSRPARRNSEAPRKESVRPVEIRGRQLLQWELQFDRRQTHLNLTDEETVERTASLFGPVYREAYLFTADAEIAARAGREGVALTVRPASCSLPLVAEHDRRKHHLIPEGQPCPFLEALGVMNAAGQVKQARQKKFRQINRYLEIVNDVTGQLPREGTLRIVDFGCGLSYLTFAVHHLLTSLHGRRIALLGVDQNEQVIARCRAIAETLNLSGIEFTKERIDRLTGNGVDLAISLHACDTATDDALAWSVSAGARVILAAPCCQHELAKRVDAQPLEALLRHGILKERFAALASDGLRALALEAAGYRTQILEFIDLEHTPKNLLLRAVRRADALRDAAAAKEYTELKSILGTARLATDRIGGDLAEGCRHA